MVLQELYLFTRIRHNNTRGNDARATCSELLTWNIGVQDVVIFYFFLLLKYHIWNI